MLRGAVRTLRYARSWKSGADVVAHETEFDRDGTMVPATLILPAGRTGPYPGWVALGGISRMGRFHPQLVRFAESLASSGAAVLIPEVPEWRELKVTPRPVGPTLRGCLGALDACPDVQPGKVGVIGFSFGAPQLAIAAACEDLADRVAGIVLFGGYSSLERTIRCQFTGDHEWQGVKYALDPDPYGRYVVGHNHLTDVAGYEDCGDVAAALYRLAAAASELRISAWEPHHDVLIGQLRASLPQGRRELFDLFATPTCGRRPPVDACNEMAGKLAEAAGRIEPMLEPAAHLKDVRLSTRLIHGRGDRLIPFTECLRMVEGLPATSLEGHTVTGLFNHTADRASGSTFTQIREKAAFFEVLRGLINTV